MNIYLCLLLLNAFSRQRVDFEDKKGLKFTLKTFLAAKYTKSEAQKHSKGFIYIYVQFSRPKAPIMPQNPPLPCIMKMSCVMFLISENSFFCQPRITKNTFLPHLLCKICLSEEK